MSQEIRERVSAIITAYNCSSFLAESIRSVLGQSRLPDEIVVVDDGSSDDTPGVAAGFASDGVRCVRQGNAGPGAARNRGIAETSGDYVAFLDCDDIWLPEKIERQLSYMQAHPEAGLVSGDMWWWEVRTGRRWVHRYRPKPGANIMREALVRNVIGNPSIFFVRRSALERLGGFDGSLHWGEDWEFGLRYARRSNVGFVPEPLIVYRRHSPSRSQFNRWEHLASLLEISRREIAQYHPSIWRPLLFARAVSKTELQRAYFAIDDGRPRAAQIGCAARALLAYPFESTFEKTRMMIRVLLGEAVYGWLRSALKKESSGG